MLFLILATATILGFFLIKTDTLKHVLLDIVEVGYNLVQKIFNK